MPPKKRERGTDASSGSDSDSSGSSSSSSSSSSKSSAKSREESSSSSSSSSSVSESSSSSSSSSTSSAKRPKSSAGHSSSGSESDSDEEDSDEETDQSSGSEENYLSSDEIRPNDEDFRPIEFRLKQDNLTWDGPPRPRAEVARTDPLKDHLRMVARRAELIATGELDPSAPPERNGRPPRPKWDESIKVVPEADPNESKMPKTASDSIKACTLCVDRPIATVIDPCGHRIMCITCAQRFKIPIRQRSNESRCPICREYMTKILRTYDT